MKGLSWWIFPLLVVVCACRKHGDGTMFEEEDWYAGGTQTSFVFGSGAYSQAFATLNPGEMGIHGVGDKAFEAIFVSAPAPVNGGIAAAAAQEPEAKPDKDAVRSLGGGGGAENEEAPADPMPEFTQALKERFKPRRK